MDEGDVVVVVVVQFIDWLRTGVAASAQVVIQLPVKIDRGGDPVMIAEVMVQPAVVSVASGVYGIKDMDAGDMPDGFGRIHRLIRAGSIRSLKWKRAENGLGQRSGCGIQPGEFAWCGDLFVDIAAGPGVDAVVGEREECLVFYNRPADQAAKLIANVFGLVAALPVLEEVGTVEAAIPV